MLHITRRQDATSNTLQLRPGPVVPPAGGGDRWPYHPLGLRRGKEVKGGCNEQRRSDKNSNLALGLKLRCASLMHLDRKPFAIDLPKTEAGQKAFTQVEVLLDSALVAAVHRPRDVRTCPGTRAQEGRSERRAALSRAHEAEQRDGQVRFSVRPCLSPSWDWAYGPVVRRPPSVPVEYPD